MDSNEKRRFIRELCENIADSLVSNIAKMPEEWDGLELRELIATKAKDACHMSSQPKRFRRRLRDYRNEAIVRNL